jgi:poly(3-hydroxybutyrate) depolymerase
MVMVGDESRNALIEPVPGASRTVDLMWDKLAEPALSRDEAESLIGMAFEAREARIAAERQPEIDANAFTLGDHTLKILEKTFGDEPDSGRSLWISMHGGGGAPAEVNDQQWQNQIKLYQPEEGIYIAPRAPTDTWNLWHQAHIDDLFDRLIETYIATRNVNPDKVYLMGYSAGGDGVFQLAPRMADRFAAAAMMAGHPNETTPDGLRNLPFALFMGGKDGAYNRNTVAEQWGERLAELAESDPGGYPHLVRIYPDHGHWMNGDDKEALPWMAEHVRHAWPKKVVWKQDDVTHTRFYWLGVEKDDATPRAVITAAVDAQTIDVAAEDLTAVTLYLRDALLDLDLPVLVRVNGETVYSGAVPRTRAAIERSLTGRADPVLAATAILDLSW